MNPVEDFIDSLTGKQRDIILHLHLWLLQFEGVNAKISFGIPMYYRKKWICYLNPLKNGGVEFVFSRGNGLQDTSGLLNNVSST